MKKLFNILLISTTILMGCVSETYSQTNTSGTVTVSVYVGDYDTTHYGMYARTTSFYPNSDSIDMIVPLAPFVVNGLLGDITITYSLPDQWQTGTAYFHPTLLRVGLLPGGSVYNECSEIDSIWITSRLGMDSSYIFNFYLCSGTSIDDDLAQKNKPTISIYPNPTDNGINIVSDKEYRYDIIAMNGKHTGLTYVGKNIREYTDLPSGLYAILVSDNGQYVSSNRLVIRN